MVIVVKNHTFRGRRRGGLKQALFGTGDDELRELQAAISARQERVAELELELFDMRSEVAAFEREMEDRLGLLKRHIERLEKQIEEARRQAARRAQWGDRADSPDVPEDVVEQFRKTWTRSDKPSEPTPKKQVNEATKEELKSIYRQLAKRYHPDLVTDPEEKKWREVQMARVNQAYSESDVAALLSFEGDVEWTPIPSHKSREDEITELSAEVKRLDRVIDGLERELRELINSETVRWMLDVSVARKAGQDLLRAVEKELMERISVLQRELESIT
jgi:predicted  nucleic acid-binding Zn-ribbon protein